MKVTLCRTLQFDSAHRNTAPTASSRAARMHGHTYEVEIRLSGTVDESMGWLLDFGDIKSAANTVIDRLDHRCLNDIADLHDTSLPDLNRYIASQLQTSYPDGLLCPVRIIGATNFDPVVDRITASQDHSVITFGFAAAHFLPRVPEGHKCRRLHGHSFGVTIQTAEPEQLLPLIGEIYPQLDHTLLNDLPGLENPTSEILARWLWGQLGNQTAHIRELGISETCTTRCLYRGED